MKYLQKSIIVFVVLLTLLSNCFAATSFLAAEIKFTGFFGTKSADTATYIYLGPRWLTPLRTEMSVEFASKWLEAHPFAKVTLISNIESGANFRRPDSELLYVWIEDDEDCLNLALIRNGIFPGYVMIDSVEAEQRMAASLLDPKFALMRELIEKNRATRPKGNTPKRFVSDLDYKARLIRIEKAESEARAKKLGIWSDDFKSEREALGVL